MQRQRFFYVLVVIYVSFLFALCSSGCEPLRKKFIREKKKDKESQEIVPVLEPEEYPVKSISPEEQYRYFYSLWRVWYRDLIQAIDENSSKKRQIYLLNQEIKQLEKMSELLIDEKRELLVPVIEELRDLLQRLQLPAKLKNTFVIKKRLRDIDKKLHDNFRPKIVDIFIRK